MAIFVVVYLLPEQFSCKFSRKIDEKMIIGEKGLVTISRDIVK